MELKMFLSNLGTSGYSATGWVSCDESCRVYNDDVRHPGLYRQVHDAFEQCADFILFEKNFGSIFDIGGTIKIFLSDGAIFLFTQERQEDNSESGNGFEETYTLEKFSEERYLDLVCEKAMPEALKKILA